MTPHTPGPWTNQHKGREAFICGNAVHVASVPLEDEQDEANARLIAAAPRMYAFTLAFLKGEATLAEAEAIRQEVTDGRT